MNTDLAGRIVRGVIAAMVAAVAAATAVGFWLSYGGLHDFAVTAGGLTGPEAWAWPASVDLFIVAGEAGVTISALRHRLDVMAWCYLALGFAASVTGNVLHVHPGELSWAKYAVAAVPPVAAMLALAALLRHVYRFALDAHPVMLPAKKAAEVKAETAAVPVTVREPAPKPRETAVTGDRVARLLASSPQLTVPEIARKAGVSQSTVARRKRDMRKVATMAVNGNGKAH